MHEAQFQAEVIKLADSHDVKVFHSTDSRKDIGPGFPDLVLVGVDDILFAELKTSGGTMSSKQTDWRYSIIAAGHRHEVWRPADLNSGVIEAYLENL